MPHVPSTSPDFEKWVGGLAGAVTKWVNPPTATFRKFTHLYLRRFGWLGGSAFCGFLGGSRWVATFTGKKNMI